MRFLETGTAWVSELYFVVALALFMATLGAMSPRILGRHVEVGFGVVAMVLTYFVPQLIAFSVLATLFAHFAGALEEPVGLVGLVLLLTSTGALAIHALRMHAVLPTLDGEPVRDEDQPFMHGLTDDERGQLQPGQISWRPTLTLRIPAMLQVQVTRGVLYRQVGRVRLHLDVYRPREGDGPRPMIVYIHGGGWFTGTRRQSRYMMYELAAAGWVVFSVSYRLAPWFPLPAAIEDTKCALAWAKAHAAEYGARSDCVVVVGGSAGGHLAAMAAFSPNNPRFQPGFEDADTRVDAAVLLYGATDLTGPFGAEERDPGRALFLERVVFRRRYADDPDWFHAVEPRAHVSPSAPPTLLIHGERDGVVPIATSRKLARVLRDVGARVHLLELPLAHHAFEVFPSPLHQRAVRVVVRFIESVRRELEQGRVPVAVSAPSDGAASVGPAWTVNTTVEGH